MRCRSLMLLLLSMLTSPVLSAELRVPEEHGTIQAAIDAAADGDTVLVGPGTHEVSAPIGFAGKKIKVRSRDGAATTRIALAAGHDPARAALVAFEGSESSAAALEGFTLEGGRGILVPGQSLPFAGPLNPRVGGAIYIGSHVEARVKDCVFRGNLADHGGAVFCAVDSAPVFSGNIFEGNKAVLSSGAENVDFKAKGGAIVCLSDSNLTVGGGVFAGNEADDGGAIYTADDTTLELINVRLEGNVARTDDGGAVLSRSGNVRFFGTTFRGNSCAHEGGGVRLRFQSVLVRPATIVIDECVFAENRAMLGGGAAFDIGRSFPPAPPSRIELLRTTFERNEATGSGGGWLGGYESEDTTFNGCTFLDNHASEGGGVFLGYLNDTVFTDCRFLANSAILGGAMFGSEEGSLIATRCVFQSNVAAWTGGAVGSARGFSFPRVFDHCTFAGNAAGIGASCVGPPLEAPDGAFGSIKSSILWGNAGTPLSGVGEITYSCVQGSTAPAGAGNIAADPLFAGWRGAEEVHVDGSRNEPGDGTAASPWRSFRSAIDGFDLALVEGSPCAGAGEGGSDMGADTGRAPVRLGVRRVVRVRAGRYELSRISLAGKVSVLGEGAGVTVVAGAVLGLQTGAELSGMTVRGGIPAGVPIALGESPTLRDLAIIGCRPPSLGIWTPYYVYPQPLQGGSYDLRAAGGGWGVACGPGSSPLLDHCTITGNVTAPYLERSECDNPARLTASGILSRNGLPRLESCIVWGNVGGSILGPVEAARSCVEGPTVLPGEGNINVDPRLGGWLIGDEAYIDPRAPEGGDGSRARPFRRFSELIESYSVKLVQGSPCVGTGKDGTDRGARAGIAEAGASGPLTARLAAGVYDAGELTGALGLNIAGAGAGQTVLIGTLVGLRTGFTLSDMTLSGGDYQRGSLSITACESPTVRRVAFEKAFRGLHVAGAAPRLELCTFGRTLESIFLQAGAQLQLDSCRVEGAHNIATLYNGSRVEGVNCVFAACSFGFQVLDASRLVLRNCTFGAWTVEPVTCHAVPASSILENCLLEPGTSASNCAELRSTVRGPDARFVRRGVYQLNRFSASGLPGYLDNQLPDFVDTPGDYRLTASSPAIDAGAAAGAPAVDFDGNPRPCGAGVDAGAYEFGGCGATAFRRGDANADDKADLADAVSILAYLFLGDVEPSCLKAADVNDSGDLDLSDPVGLLRYLFLGAAAPPQPFDACGEDATADELGCTGFPPCAGE